MRTTDEVSKIATTPIATPFLRWVGGKRQLAATLLSRLPEDAADRRYVEPFLGAGSIFFAHAPKLALLADANPFLIATYQAIKDDPVGVLRHLRSNIRRHSKDYYYDTRALYNRLEHSPAQAARFIYLNMTCFNGIFRVNQKGQFNVPKGSKDNLQTPSVQAYQAASRLLQNAALQTADFSETLAACKSDDFVYLDPPYPALTETAFFTHYTSARFGATSQKVLADRVRALDNLGVPFLMSNADVPSIRDLYKGFCIAQLPVKRYVSCKGLRTPVMELLISNY